jgi:hypothetical protein
MATKVKRPSKHWAYKRIVEAMFLNENDVPVQQVRLLLVVWLML